MFKFFNSMAISSGISGAQAEIQRDKTIDPNI
jgi:hypothetical protein